MKHWNTLTQAQKIIRWENVLRVLRGLSRHERKKHWNMADWGEKTDCGTVACAAGHCGLDPWFRRQGLKFNFTKYAFTNEYFGNWDVCTDTNDFTVDHFFGDVGTYNIFYNGDARPVGKVINEVRCHLTQLRKGKDLR